MNNKCILLVMCFLCFGFILFNSSQVSTVSNERSKEIVNELIKVIPNTNKGEIKSSKYTKKELNLMVRKIAHSFEYFLFGLVLCFTLRAFKANDSNILIYTLFIVLFFAVIDETFQLSIKGRSSSVIDVLIDFSGGILANLMFFIFSGSVGKHYKESVRIKD